MLLFASIAEAAIITGSTPGFNPMTGFPLGNLNQNQTNCTGGQNGCGPTAAVNSFVMLQNLYPQTYDKSLVPSAAAGNNPTQAEMAAIANQLGDSEPMNPNPTTYMDCQSCNGTYIENFIYGKQKYMEEKVPGKTVYNAYVGGTFEWRNNPGGTPGYNNGGQPGYVTRGAPTAAWLAGELSRGEDVEIFIERTNGTSHYLTLNSISFNDATNTGTIGAIDPLTGGPVTANITGLNGDGYLTLNYSAGSTLFHAVSESPVPEPGTWVLTLIGTVAILLRVRRRESL